MYASRTREKEFSGHDENCQQNASNLKGSLVTSSRPPGRPQKRPDDRTSNGGVAAQAADCSRRTVLRRAAYWPWSPILVYILVYISLYRTPCTDTGDGEDDDTALQLPRIPTTARWRTEWPVQQVGGSSRMGFISVSSGLSRMGPGRRSEPADKKTRRQWWFWGLHLDGAVRWP